MRILRIHSKYCEKNKQEFYEFVQNRMKVSKNCVKKVNKNCCSISTKLFRNNKGRFGEIVHNRFVNSFKTERRNIIMFREFIRDGVEGVYKIFGNSF